MRNKTESHHGSVELETVFHAEGSSLAEIETLDVKGLLEANGIPVIIVGDSMFPNLPYELRVPSADADRARRLISEADKAPVPPPGPQPSR